MEKAFSGDPKHNLELEDKDVVEVFKVDRMRLPEQVALNGPFTAAGTFPLHKDMRVSDLVFKAGIPKLSANRFIAELARSQYGKPSLISKLELSGLLSSEEGSPLNLPDDKLNPLLAPDDIVTVYEKPGFRIHRAIKILGQVEKPGTYILDSEKPTLSDAIARAGGLLPDAMPSAGIFLRTLGGTEVDDLLASNGTKGVSDILERMSETKIVELRSTGGTSNAPSAPPILFKAPVLHGLGSMKLNRVITDFNKAIKKDRSADLELVDGDEIIIPKQTETAMIIGETTSPFALFDVHGGMAVSTMLKAAGGLTNNADSKNIRLLKANGQIYDSWVKFRTVEPGDSLLVPQRIRRETAWQDNMQALMPVAMLLNALR